MKGALTQLSAFGAEDIPLMGDPEITFFKKTYKRHTNFAMESYQNQFIDIPAFGGTSVITIVKYSDLLSRLYFEVTLPHDENLTDSYWTNRIGFNLIQRVELYIGKKLIDRQYGLWMHIWSELSHSTEMKGLLDMMVGTKYEDGYSNGLPCNVPHKLKIPLFFSFCRHSGLAIPMNAIRNNQDITLKFYFEKKENCIQYGRAPYGDIVFPSIWGDYIYLDTEENRLYVQQPLEYLIEVVQHHEKNIASTGVKAIILPFTLPCKELFWAVYDNKRTGDKFTDFTNGMDSMVNSVQFKFNTKNVFSTGAKKNKYFNYIQPYQHHGKKPDLGINCYSFSVFPEELEPSGFIHFGHLDTAVMNINSKKNGFIHIFAHSYNILKIGGGNMELAYKF